MGALNIIEIAKVHAKVAFTSLQLVCIMSARVITCYAIMHCTYINTETITTIRIKADLRKGGERESCLTFLRHDNADRIDVLKINID